MEGFAPVSDIHFPPIRSSSFTTPTILANGEEEGFSPPHQSPLIPLAHRELVAYDRNMIFPTKSDYDGPGESMVGCLTSLSAQSTTGRRASGGL